MNTFYVKIKLTLGYNDISTDSWSVKGVWS